ncbi:MULTISPECIES: molecular chaperone HtpG [Psychrilyobacter]|uniref:Chaperone protein HtpG n=1 Tax=Psychrilyobacter piezotolerans TaxID=2293438 RepID=A0ABX9KIW0_9FUSO|nr:MULTISPECIES: molecular chaperone HtpG [Psychrilyobacter]MCS5421115.1 molecular chaperone HtpG [Psychrilyobacter sp. S5]NDI77113.1 molecular chaperone HtpG [Psychrilyobacter piezotolerans]RDE64112.1 molecular chaperone HtpG [Psychrilyobacter sp. S5]REI42204.1 molecular chaperone HtpG [Psychrilyobacter piezotolerans]
MHKETLNFQTETKELLNLMIHSIYTHKEIFLRELISNASDALDKLKFKALTDQNILKNDNEFKIEIFINKEKNTITIKDNGIGMTHEEVVSNIGTIAKSGSREFTQALKEAKNNNNDLSVIGQFGVGFYSSFMVADKITLKTKSPDSDTGVKWVSTGEGSFTIEDTKQSHRGTEIILHLREEENKEDSNAEYLEEYKIKELIQKYSDYVRYPILLEVTKTIEDEETKEKVETVELEKINSQTPLWKKSKTKITEEEYNEFYQGKFHDWTDPLKTIHFKVEGNLDYAALLYIPSKTPMDFYSKEFEKGLQLYSKNVFIMEKCKELIPDHFRFIKGLVDSPDLSLNISREILQQNRQLAIIAKNLEKKIQKELEKMLESDRDEYIKFWNEFGINIKGGIYEEFGRYKDTLKNLLIFNTTKDDNMTTLMEYKDRMPEDQKHIYYVSGDNIKSLEKMPQLEGIKAKGWEVLYFTDKIDEFAIKSLGSFENLTFKSIHEANEELSSEDDKKMLDEVEKDNSDLFTKIKEALGDKVSKVRPTTRLKSSAVCLVSGTDGISFEMEKVMAEIPGDNPMGALKAERILEINSNHELFKALIKVNETHPENLSKYAEVLYSQALLIEGFQLEDPIEFANNMTELLIKASKN